MSSVFSGVDFVYFGCADYLFELSYVHSGGTHGKNLKWGAGLCFACNFRKKTYFVCRHFKIEYDYNGTTS